MTAIAKSALWRGKTWRPPAGAAHRPYAHDTADGDAVEAQFPEPLPAGEHILWHGGPRAWRLALRALHIRKVAVYFAALLLWRALETWSAGATPSAAAASALGLLPLAAAGLGLLGLLAWAMARTTLYTITDRRVILRIGVALPITVNIPFAIVDGAQMKRRRDGSGDLALQLRRGDRIAYLHLWPHVRPWRFTQPCPMLRGLDDVEAVGRVLARALERSSVEAGADRDAPSAADAAPVPAREVLA